ncbi:hypothetical protein DAI43_16815 [Achromobacter xylosoxidans]|nr:hypothetical protein DAI43_16815 [Achromobacter xylosoxidans]
MSAASKLPGLEADLPPSLKPQLATLVDGVPRHGDDWLYEVKFDGWAYQCHCLGMSWATSLVARNGRFRTSRVGLTWPTHRGTTTRRKRSARP